MTMKTRSNLGLCGKVIWLTARIHRGVDLFVTRITELVDYDIMVQNHRR